MALAAKFEVVQSGSGYRWVLKSQGRTLAIGATYQRRAMAEKAIASFRTAAVAATVDNRTPTRGTAALAKATRVTGRAVTKGARALQKAEKAVATADPKEVIQKGLAKLDQTVAEIKKATRKPAKRATKTR